MMRDVELPGSGLWRGVARIGGRTCALAVADVNYTAPRQILDLAREIRPRVIVCLGLGGETVFETGALNSVARGRPVYDRDGKPIETGGLDTNGPDTGILDPALPENAAISLPWGAGNLARLREIAARWTEPGNLGPLGSVRVAPAARPDNNYVCNATAWAVARVMTQAGSPSECAGFLHVAPPKTPSDGYFLAAANLLVDVVRAIRPE